MPAMLTYRAGAITGFIDRKIVDCHVYPGQPGNLPAPGEYLIGAPAQDLVYGPVAVMVRADRGLDPGLSMECIRRLPFDDGSKLNPTGRQVGSAISAGGMVVSAIAAGVPKTQYNPAGGRTAGGLAEMTKQEMPGVAIAMMKSTGLSTAGAPFVLATRAIGGGNCLVAAASSGIFEALAAEGGAQLTVR